MTSEKYAPFKKKVDNWGLFDKTNSKHRRILSILRQLNWTVEHPRHGEVADLKRLSDWLKSNLSPVNKPLLEMDNKIELPKIITALEGIVKSKYNKL